MEKLLHTFSSTSLHTQKVRANTIEAGRVLLRSIPFPLASKLHSQGIDLNAWKNLTSIS